MAWRSLLLLFSLGAAPVAPLALQVQAQIRISTDGRTVQQLIHNGAPQ